MLLSEARIRVQQILDDPDAVRWTTTEIDTALGIALQKCCMRIAASCGRLDELVTPTISNGQLALATYTPLQVKGVALNLGSTVVPVDEVTPGGFISTTPYNGLATCIIVRTPTFPASASTHFTYGASLQDYAPLDQLLCMEAAAMLLVKDREAPASLQKQVADLYDIIVNTDNRIQVFDMVSPGLKSPYVRMTVGMTMYFGYQQGAVNMEFFP